MRILFVRNNAILKSIYSDIRFLHLVTYKSFDSSDISFSLPTPTKTVSFNFQKYCFSCKNKDKIEQVTCYSTYWIEWLLSWNELFDNDRPKGPLPKKGLTKTEGSLLQIYIRTWFTLKLMLILCLNMFKIWKKWSFRVLVKLHSLLHRFSYTFGRFFLNFFQFR